MTATSTSETMPVKAMARSALSFLATKEAAWLIIAFGVVLRAAEYFRNAALYVDEGSLAFNIINRSFADLFNPLDFNQAAPVGFLLIEKIAVTLAGQSEYALRLAPFLFSIAALILFYFVARKTVSDRAVPVALIFFAASSYVIHYSAQLKQYSSDIASTLLIILIGLQIESEELTARRLALFAAVGGAVVWLSHPSVFVLAGVGTTLAVMALKQKQWSRLSKLAACYGLWVASFAAFYLISIKNLSANQTLEASWQNKGTFMPMPPESLADFKWFARAFVNMFSNPLGLPLPLAAGILFIVGCAALFIKNRERLFLLISPIAFTLTASGFHLYPFGRRLLLFLAPILLLAISAGIKFIVENRKPYSTLAGFLAFEAALFQLISGGAMSLASKPMVLFIILSSMAIGALVFVNRIGKRWALGPALGFSVLALLLAQPVGGAMSRAINRDSPDDIRLALQHIKNNWQQDDVIYVYHHIRQSFLYYAPRFGFSQQQYYLGADARAHWKDGVNEAYLRDLDQLNGRNRAWFLFSLVRTIKGANEENYLTNELERRGQRQDEFRQAGASAYLYDLNLRRDIDHR